MRRIILPSVACPSLPHFSTLSRKRTTFREKLLNMNLCLDFLYNFVWNTFHSKKNSIRYCNKYAYLLTYFITPWSRVLHEKLTGSAASQEIPLIFGTPRFITVLTSARHLSLSWANSIQSSQPPPTSWRSILILSSHLRLGLPNGLFPSFHHQNPEHRCTGKQVGTTIRNVATKDTILEGGRK